MKKLFFVFSLCSSILAYGQIPTSGMLAEYLFNSGSLNDSKGGITMSHGGTALTLEANHAGGSNRAVNLNGDHLQRSSMSPLDNLSASFWIKTSTNDGTKRTIIDQSQRTSDADDINQIGWYIYLQNGKVGVSSNFYYKYQVGSTVYQGNQGYASVLGSTNVSDGDWHHVAVTIYKRIYYWQNSNWLFENTYSVYIDGVLAGSNNHYRHAHLGAAVLSSTMFPSEPVTIGNNKNLSLNNRFTESIDDVRFYNGVKNSTEVAQLANETACAGSTSVTAVAQDRTVQLGLDGTIAVSASLINNGSLNSCGEAATLSLDITSFTCDQLGDNTVTLTASDVEGNTNTATAVVTVTPYIHTQGVTLTLDPSGNATLTIEQVETGNSSQCDGLTYSLSQSVFTCDDLGFNDIFYTANYGDGQSSASHAYITVVAGVTAITQDIEVELNDNGMATITTDMVDDGSSGSCPASVLSYSLSKTTFTCNDLGPNTVTFIVKDQYNKADTATAVVTVTSAINDQTVSTINSSSFCTDGSSGAVISIDGSVDGIPYYLRNSADNSIVDGPIIGTGSGIDFNTGLLSATTTFNVYAAPESSERYGLDFDGTNDLLVAAMDENFNYQNGYTLEAWVNGPLTSASKHYPIFHIGTSATSDIEVYLQNQSNKIIVAHNRRSAGGITYGEYPTPPANTWYHLSVTYNGANIKVYYDGVEKTALTSNSGGGLLTKTAGAQLTIGYVQSSLWATALRNFEGKMDEVRLWNRAKTVEEILAEKDVCLSGSESGLVNYYNFDDGAGTTAVDLVGGFNATLTNMDGNADWVAGANINCGGCGVQMSTEITIGDTDVPAIIAQNITLPLGINGMTTLVASTLDNGSSDDCTSDNALIFSVDNADFTCEDIGDNQVTLTVTDASGNHAETTVTVTVADQLAPTVVTQNKFVALDANGNAVISAAEINNGSSDNCTAVESLVLSLDKTEFTCDDIGENIVTLMATDVAGNQSTATSTVTVFDNIAPIAIGKNVSLPLDESGNAQLLEANVDDRSSDNCTASEHLIFGLSKSAFTCSDLGINTVSFTVTDGSGVQSSVSVEVTVIDDLLPTVITQDLSIWLNADNEAIITPQEVDNGSSDNCNLILTLDQSTFNETHLGTNQVVLTADDGNGNTSTGTATITVFEHQVAQTITFGELSNKQYGDLPFALSASSSSELPVSFEVMEGPAELNGSTLSILGAGMVTIRASQPGNNDFLEAPGVEQQFEVTKASLVVTADDKSMIFEGALPELTFGYAGFVNGDDASDLISEPSISTEAMATSHVGEYEIVLSGGLADNYTFSLVDGTLTITKATAQIAITNLEFEEDGFPKSPDIGTTPAGLSTVITYDGNVNAPINAGSYQVIVTINDLNWTGSAAAILTITAIPLAIAPGEQFIQVYPNPVIDRLNVKLKKGDKAVAQLITLEGRQVGRYELNDSRQEIDLSDFMNGIYFLTITDEKSGVMIQQKVIKIN